ncbi:hypothetical protein ACFL0W_02495 [Nanoarchaeota archaeon]
MTSEKINSNFSLLAIVAIFAIAGIVIMVIGGRCAPVQERAMAQSEVITMEESEEMLDMTTETEGDMAGMVHAILPKDSKLLYAYANKDYGDLRNMAWQKNEIVTINPNFYDGSIKRWSFVLDNPVKQVGLSWLNLEYDATKSQPYFDALGKEILVRIRPQKVGRDRSGGITFGMQWPDCNQPLTLSGVRPLAGYHYVNIKFDLGFLQYGWGGSCADRNENYVKTISLAGKGVNTKNAEEATIHIKVISPNEAEIRVNAVKIGTMPLKRTQGQIGFYNINSKTYFSEYKIGELASSQVSFTTQVDTSDSVASEYKEGQCNPIDMDTKNYLTKIPDSNDKKSNLRSVRVWAGWKWVTEYDNCENILQVNKLVCNKNTGMLQREVYDCPKPTICGLGVCGRDTGSGYEPGACYFKSDVDGQHPQTNFFKKGYIKVLNKRITSAGLDTNSNYDRVYDHCWGADSDGTDRLIEFYCGGTYKTKIVRCPMGCEDGACKGGTYQTWPVN